MKPANSTCFVRLFGGLVILATLYARADVNYWTKTNSGDWGESASWSLGLPNSTQSIMITNSGWKAVSINPTTPVLFPDSMTVGSLTIFGSTNTENTLLLNSFGLNPPLKVLNSCLIQPHGTIQNSSSSFEIDGGTLTIEGGTFTQEGGNTVANVPVNVNSNGVFGVTNGAVTFGALTLGSTQANGYLSQNGGSLLAQKVSVENGLYSLSSGTLYAIGGTEVGGFGEFQQTGGTNYGDITVGTFAPGSGRYLINGGLAKGNVLIASNDFFQQGGVVDMQTVDWTSHQGGFFLGTLRSQSINVHRDSLVFMGQGDITPGSVETGSLTMSNTAHLEVASYNLTVTNSLDITGEATNSSALSYLTLISSTVHVGTINMHNYSYIHQFGPGSTELTSGLAMEGGRYILDAGVLEGPYVGVGLNATFQQIGGQHFVHGVLSNTGTYDMSLGTLVTEGVYLRGSLLLGTNSSGIHFTNTGSINLGGTLSTGTANAWPGEVQLSTNATIGFVGTPAQLHFAASSGMSWIPSALIVVTNWNNSGNTRIFFGSAASALTASQLAQIQFSNPGGLAAGVYSAKILSTGEVVPDQASSPSGPVNSWITPGSGNWDQATNWSLGVLPNSSQSVMITNPVWKAVAINASTPTNFPGAMTVSNLVISGTINTENTLLLNFVGTATPLTVLNGLALQDGAHILNFNSGLVVQGGTIGITNSQIIQDGGFIRMTNAGMYFFNSEYDITNGVFEAGSVLVGSGGPSHFNQYGGTVMITNLNFIYGSTYALYGGTLTLPGGLTFYDTHTTASYLQEGGTNRTTDIVLEPGLSGPSPDFTLNGGLLADNNVSILADSIFTDLQQNGGTHSISNVLNVMGGTRTGSIRPAVYQLNGGTLSARSISLDSHQGDGRFVQSNGVAHAEEIQAFGQAFWGARSEITLAGGTLSCSNLSSIDGGVIHQYGGVLVVSNLFNLGGYLETPGPIIYSRYELLGGTLSASNINVGADWIIGDSTTNRINNPGTITLSHTLQISNAVEQLGRFILASNSMINLAGSASQLSFANSSGEAWNGGATLVISNWNGNSSGGGAEQLKFGSNQSGLTSAQLGQIQFRVGTNSYSAKILNTGEVVPDQVIQPTVAFSKQGNNLVLNWPAGWTLQTSTNISGPFLDLPNVTSPYTNDMTVTPQRYFRLKQ
jgi:hypothetical protein